MDNHFKKEITATGLLSVLIRPPQAQESLGHIAEVFQKSWASVLPCSIAKGPSSFVRDRADSQFQIGHNLGHLY